MPMSWSKLTDNYGSVRVRFRYFMKISDPLALGATPLSSSLLRFLSVLIFLTIYVIFGSPNKLFFLVWLRHWRDSLTEGNMLGRRIGSFKVLKIECSIVQNKDFLRSVFESTAQSANFSGSSSGQFRNFTFLKMKAYQYICVLNCSL